MGTFLTRPAVADLVFRLYGRPLHPELFEILAGRKVRKEDYEVTAQVTRTGHVITWRCGTHWLTEVTAACDQPMPGQHRLLEQRLRGEHNGHVRCGPGLTYQMTFQVEVMTPEIFYHIHEEILADGSKRGLLHSFPASHRFRLTPLGFLTVEARSGCLFLTSFHTFPDELTVVKTQSLIERL